MVEVGDRLLAREEPFAGDEVRAALEAEGVTVVAGVARPTAGRGPHPDGPVRGRRSATAADVRGDELLVAAGRRPSTERRSAWTTVGLEPGGPSRSTTGCAPTGSPGGWLYAVGDCNGLAPLTHMGKYQARHRRRRHPRQGRPRPRRARRGAPGDLHRPPGVRRRADRGGGAGARASTCGPSTYGTGDVAGAYTLGNGVARHQQARRRRARAASSWAPPSPGPGVQELLHSATVAIAGEVPLDAALARRAVVPDHQRGLAPPARDLRTLRRATVPDVSFDNLFLVVPGGRRGAARPRLRAAAAAAVGRARAGGRHRARAGRARLGRGRPAGADPRA